MVTPASPTPWKPASRWWPLAALLALVVIPILELPIWRIFDER